MLAISEAALEDSFISMLVSLGWTHLLGSAASPDIPAPLRGSYQKAILVPRLLAALAKINPAVPTSALQEVAARLLDTTFPDLVQENEHLHGLMVNGVDAEWHQGGEVRSGKIRLIDWTDTHNDWLAINQFEVIGSTLRRPDVVLFLNGLPLVLVELKAPENENATIKEAFNQVVTYRSDLPELYRTLAFSVISDGLTARYGTLTSDFTRFMPWRTVDGETTLLDHQAPALQTLTLGLLRPDVLLQMVRRFIVYERDGLRTAKKIAGYHQFHAARKGLERVLQAVEGDGRGGVLWHTQGSGKSLLMAFFAGLLIHSEALGNPTLLILTDRNDLDEQLFQTFGQCAALFGQKPEQVEEIADLSRLLSRTVGGVIFSTIQKFRPKDGGADFPVLTDRRNVIVFVDEAHRSQYGFEAKVSAKTGEVKYGFAHYLRKALPGASFVGFTGTPVELGDRNTPVVFGSYIDRYDVAAAVEDGATVPIYYEGRVARVDLDAATLTQLENEFVEATDGQSEEERERTSQRWARLEAVVGAEQRLDRVVGDLLQHFAGRREAMSGKAMIVCMSRRICVEVYNRIIAAHPEWQSTEDDAGGVKVIMTGSAADEEAFQPHIRTKKKLQQLANRFRDPADPFQLVIVRDMWLTGFDAPCMHTLYADKPMKGHGLMQAMARVNRVFGTKPGGLVVDYIGLMAELKSALTHYGPEDRSKTGLDRQAAIKELQNRLEILRDIFHGFDYRAALVGGDAMARLGLLGGAADFVFKLEANSTEATAEERKAKSRKRFMDAVLRLITAFKLTGGSPEAHAAKEEIGFFAAVRVTILKIEAPEDDGRKKRTPEEVDHAIAQLINEAVGSTQIIDVLAASGLNRPDISVLSEEFLQSLKTMSRKNLAVEALRRLLAGEIGSRTRTNVAQGKAFSNRLSEAIARYHNRTVDAAQIIDELVNIARDLQAQPDSGLTPEETAFYDALASNDSAVQVMGNEQLRIMATELVRTIRSNASVDWWKRDAVRSKIRIAVKRLLRKYGYPPDLESQAVINVVQQAEALASEMSLAT